MVTRKQRVINPQALTTAQVAKMCGVSDYTVRKWCDEGMLRYWTLPGGNIKIKYVDLKRFCIETNMTVPNGW